MINWPGFLWGHRLGENSKMLYNHVQYIHLLASTTSTTDK